MSYANFNNPINPLFRKLAYRRKQILAVFIFLFFFGFITIFFFFQKKSRALPKQIMERRKYFQIPVEADVVAYILKESDNALKYETRLEQNEYFSSLRNIYHLKPIKMTLQTTVFLYKMEQDHLIEGKINSTSSNNRLSNKVSTKDETINDKHTNYDQSIINSHHSKRDTNKRMISDSKYIHSPNTKENSSRFSKRRMSETPRRSFEMSKCYFYQKAHFNIENDLSPENRAFNLPIHYLMVRPSTELNDFYDSKYIVIKRAIIREETGTQEDIISMRIDHPNLLKTYKTFRLNHVKRKRDNFSESEEVAQQEIVFLYSEFLRYRISNKYVNMNESVIRIILRDVLDGLAYLHSQDIIHLDIKIANIMGQEVFEQDSHKNVRRQRDILGEYEADRGVRSSMRNTVSDSEQSSTFRKRLVYKLIDFGYSRDLSLYPEGKKNGEIYIQSKSYGTYPYKPPEVVFHNIHGKSSDIWCIGAVAWFLSNGKVPFYHEDGEKNTAENRKFLKGQKRHFFHPNISHELKDFILVCMNTKRQLRPSAAELLNHYFITGQKFDDHIDSGYETDTDSTST